MRSQLTKRFPKVEAGPNPNFACTLAARERANLDAAASRGDHERLLTLGCEQSLDDGEYELWSLTQRGYTSGSGERVMMWTSRS